MKLFVVWDQTTPSIELTLDSLRRHPPDRVEVNVPIVQPNSGAILRDVVVEGIQNADRVLVFADKPNANVGFETGLAYGLDREVALIVQREPRPEWLEKPPFANFLVQSVDGLKAIKAAIQQNSLWRRREQFLAGVADPVSTVTTLFLCPSRFEGESLETEQEALFPHWRTTPDFNFNFHDIPNLLRGVERLVWTISSFGQGADERDGGQNAGNGVIAGWFFAEVLKRHAGASYETAIADLRKRFHVLRSKEARRVVDVEIFEKSFNNLGAFAELLREVERSPTGSALPAPSPARVSSGSPQERESVEAIRALLNSRLTAGGVLDLANSLDPAGPISIAVSSQLANKRAMIDALLDALGVERSVSSAFLKAAANLMPGSGPAIEELMGSTPDVLHAVPTGVPPRVPNLEGGKMNTGRLLGAAHRLDRTTQWGQVLDGCFGDNHCMFTLRGESRQGIGLFLERLNFYLTEKLKNQRVFNLPFKIEHETAQSGADWERRIGSALARQQPGTAAEHLNNAACKASVFLVLGLRPLHDLNEVEEAGLTEFLSKTYPDVLFTSGAAMPVHLLVPIDYDTDGGGLAERVQAAATAGEACFGKRASGSSQASRLIHYVPLKPVTFPTWDEVDAYLDNSRPRPSTGTVAKIKADFDAITSDPRSTFGNLAERLDRQLGDI